MEKLDAGIQEALVCLLCHDSEAFKLVPGLVPTATFDVYFRDIAQAAERYAIQYHKPPGEHTLDLVNGLKASNGEAADIYAKIFYSLEQIKDGINREYVLAQATNFHRHQNLRATAQKLVETLESRQNDYLDAAENVLDQARKLRVETFSTGLKLNDPSQALGFLKRQEDPDDFPTGVSLLDNFDLCPARKTMWMFMAPSNRGKTWALINNGKHSLLRKKRVLHLTGEMSEDKVAMRYVQAFCSVTKRDQVVKRARFERDELGKFCGLDEETIKRRPNFQDPKIRKFLLGKLSNLAHRPPLIIKAFPTGQWTVKDLERYLDALESTIRFLPDHILVDYPDIMKQDAKNLRHSLGQTFVDLRGLAVERNVALSVVTQGNRASYTAKVIREIHTGEDISKINTSDTVITYNQTDEELRMGLARLFVAKAREESKHQQILITQAYAIGQFCLDAAPMHDTYWQYVQSENGEDEDEDEND